MKKQSYKFRGGARRGFLSSYEKTPMAKCTYVRWIKGYSQATLVASCHTISGTIGSYRMCMCKMFFLLIENHLTWTSVEKYFSNR